MVTIAVIIIRGNNMIMMVISIMIMMMMIRMMIMVTMLSVIMIKKTIAPTEIIRSKTFKSTGDQVEMNSSSKLPRI